MSLVYDVSVKRGGNGDVVTFSRDGRHFFQVFHDAAGEPLKVLWPHGAKARALWRRPDPLPLYVKRLLDRAAAARKSSPSRRPAA